MIVTEMVALNILLEQITIFMQNKFTESRLIKLYLLRQSAIREKIIENGLTWAAIVPIIFIFVQ